MTMHALTLTSSKTKLTRLNLWTGAQLDSFQFYHYRMSDECSCSDAFALHVFLIVTHILMATLCWCGVSKDDGIASAMARRWEKYCRQERNRLAVIVRNATYRVVFDPPRVIDKVLGVKYRVINDEGVDVTSFERTFNTCDRIVEFADEHHLVGLDMSGYELELRRMDRWPFCPNPPAYSEVKASAPPID